MILTRPGNKKSMAGGIYKYFRPHRMRVTLFFGAGGLWFNTPRAQYNVINDLDDNITNLFLVVSDHPDDLIEVLLSMPISGTLLKKWRANQPDDPVMKAASFLLISNFTYMGRGDSIRYSVGNEKQVLIKRIHECRLRLGDSRIMCEDFREVLPKISFSHKVAAKEDSFIYLDPCYLDTVNSYKVPSWTEQDTLDCFEIMDKEGVPSAMSEFDHPFVIEQARSRGFTITPIKNRRNLKGRGNEILITNYRPQYSLF